MSSGESHRSALFYIKDMKELHVPQEKYITSNGIIYGRHQRPRNHCRLKTRRWKNNTSTYVALRYQFGISKSDNITVIVNLGVLRIEFSNIVCYFTRFPKRAGMRESLAQKTNRELNILKIHNIQFLRNYIPIGGSSRYVNGRWFRSYTSRQQKRVYGVSINYFNYLYSTYEINILKIKWKQRTEAVLVENTVIRWKHLKMVPRYRSFVSLNLERGTRLDTKKCTRKHMYKQGSMMSCRYVIREEILEASSQSVKG